MNAQLRGLEREVVKETLAKTKASSYRAECIQEVDVALLKEGNIQNVRSNAVSRKARAERLAQLDLDKNDINDVIKRHQLQSMTCPEDMYVQVVSVPLLV